jgi:hypothetical protein
VSVKRSRASVPKISGCQTVVERVEGEEEDEMLYVMYLVSPVKKEGEKSVNKRRSRNNEGKGDRGGRREENVCSFK